MRFSLFLGLVTGTIGLNGSISAARAQAVTDRSTTAVGSVCSYDTCAMRLEGALLIRGIRGERVGRVGLFSGSRLTRLLTAQSDSATAYARSFDRDHRSGAALFWSGSVATAVAVALALRRQSGTDQASLAVAVTGMAVQVSGIIRLAKAQRDLGRALWWNNRNLAR